jgi:hypothetical protein
MRTIQIALIAAALIISACKSKKSTTSTATANTSANNAPTGPGFPPKSNDGLFEPGQDELTAVQSQFADASLSQLKEGYEIYNNGSCIRCHNAKNIYKRPLEHWKGIIDDMSVRAALSNTQKEAVYRYVLSVKATQK